MPKGQNTASLCHQPGITGTPYGAFSNLHQALGSRPGPSQPSMKRTIESAGLEGPMDHCPVHSSWPRFQNGQLEAQEALTA